MAKGKFIVARDPKNSRDILFQVSSQSRSPIPQDQLALRDEVDRCSTVLRMLFLDGDDRFEEYFRPLLSLAQTGLVGNSADPELAQRALQALKAEITDREGGRVKNRYMKRLGISAITVGLPALTVALVLLSWFPNASLFSNYLLIWTGCSAGVWLSFGTRKTALQFNELHVVEKDRLEPYVRLFFAGLLSIVMGLLFSTRAVVVDFGQVSTAAARSNPEIALRIGIMCGISEQVLSPRVAKQATQLLGLTKK